MPSPAFPILGQDRALSLLARARRHGRLAHAYLFTGPEGCGKATLARAFAAALLCRHADDDPAAGACGDCPSCRQMLSGNHPDFLCIEPEGQGIKIDAIREMKKALGFPPLEGTLRVTVLKDAQTMQTAAANSLLKILEEPPPGNILLLTADDDAEMLATIRSRCQPIPLRDLPLPVAAEVIATHRPDLTEADRLALAALAEGCPGRALRIEDDILTLYRDLAAGVAEPPGAQSPAALVQKALALSARLHERKDDAAVILRPLARLLKDSLCLRLSGRAAGRSDPESAALAARAREHWNAAQLSDKLAAVSRAEGALRGNCNAALVFDALLLELICSFPPPSA